MRSAPAARTTGPATYPPPPKTTSGRRRLRMRTQAGTAVAARPTAQARRALSSRGNPSTPKTSSSYPASRTSLDSALDAKETSAPSVLSDSATASAGSTCPAVPPAAIRHFGFPDDGMVRRDVKEDAHGREADNE